MWSELLCPVRLLISLVIDGEDKMSIFDVSREREYQGERIGKQGVALRYLSPAFRMALAGDRQANMYEE